MGTDASPVPAEAPLRSIPPMGGAAVHACDKCFFGELILATAA